MNAVAKIKTELSPLALLDELQRIENEQGRVRLRRWGERTLDLDILLLRQRNHSKRTPNNSSL
ncbi:putative 7,8-Dihydro-6-hydroxymethylpterin-pyrophosphokinase, HPPK [Haemophilus haemolyticus M19107]|nr:putative 7,8-Dihydro-6-hydroxymethylpterin-pyrophosphokinase, HPPK [Haemophilus haemolyticus M19107]